MRYLDALMPPAVGHLARLALRPRYRVAHRELKRLRRLPRFQPAEVRVLGGPLRVIDGPSAASAYGAIFRNEIYRFPSARPDPRILDCGANIGLAVLYWKRLYPKCRLTAFEPDPAAFQALDENCRRRGLDSVERIERAVWTAESELEFWSQGADGGRLVQAGKPSTGCHVRVKTVRLREMLDVPVDMLKLDIEGAEVEVLADCADRLQAVENLFVEYHSFVERSQELDRILRVLREADLRVHIQPEFVMERPLVERRTHEGMDQRLNIFAYRERA